MQHEYDIIFYDGTCAMCHGFVLFLIRHDPDGRKFRFSTRAGPTFQSHIDPETQRSLPQSIVVYTREGKILVRSEGSFYLLSRIGGKWWYCAKVCVLIPRIVRDWGYDLMARFRHRIIKSRDGACPVMPPEFKNRFLP